MDREVRDYFDQQVDWVLKQLPELVHELLEEVPLYIEDYPSRKMMRDLKIKHRSQLCGCFVGRTIEQTYEGAMTPNFIMVFREALCDLSLDDEGYIDEERLRKEIKTTVLHELAHYHGMDEEEIQSLGYG